MLDKIKDKIKFLEGKVESLDNKIKSLDIKNKKVSLNSVISLSLPMYTVTILFSVFLLTKQQERFFEEKYTLQDRLNECVNIVRVTEGGYIEFLSIEEEKESLGDLFNYISCREVEPKDFRNYLHDNKSERLMF
jgi:hypothetical protein